VLALQGLDLTIEKGELTAIIGNSGSGKSTFLNMIGGLDRPTAGRLYVDGLDLFRMSEKELVEYKRSKVGFVWQNNARNLIPYLPAWQNVQMPMLLKKRADGRKRAEELLDLVGMAHKRHSKLSELSGGEQQRVAIAIALANEPDILLADEPTGSVDPQTAAYIFETFRRLNEELGLTIVIVTHDLSVADKVSRVVSIRDGKISSERIMKTDYAGRLESVGALDDTAGEAHFTSHEEYAILDRNGRVQIPPEFLTALELDGNRVKLSMEDGEVIIRAPKKAE
jgi:ABC-type lipoprotein export system ATPase subunit